MRFLSHDFNFKNGIDGGDLNNITYTTTDRRMHSGNNQLFHQTDDNSRHPTLKFKKNKQQTNAVLVTFFHMQKPSHIYMFSNIRKQ